ncbi:MAG: YncE family protein [Phycisphaerales bacterium]|nr:YncE family protein [Phycisphaerales bacterium]
MKTTRRLFAAVLVSCAALSPALAQSYSMFKVPLPMVQRSVVSPDVDGRMGRVAMDPLTGRIYVAALRHGTLQVLDDSGMKVAQVVRDLPEPQGVLVLSDQRRVLVSCGDGSVRVLGIGEKGVLTSEREIRLGGEADLMRYDQAAKRVWVGHGRNVSRIDPATGEKDKAIVMPGMVEGLAIEQRDGGRVLASIASEGQIVVIDKAKNEVSATWTLKDAKNNNPIAIDEAGGRVFVATRSPGRLLVLGAKDGAEQARFDIADDADDCWFDPIGKRVYVSAGGGAGQVAMIRQTVGGAGETFAVEHLVPTATGARTCVLSPERRRLVVIAPKIGDQQSFVYVYVVPNEGESVPAGTKQP